MRIFSQPPHPLLQSSIDRFWGWECDRDERVDLPIVLPGTGAEVFFHHGTPFRPAAESNATAPLRPLSRNHALCLRHHAIPLAPLAGIGFVAVRFRAGRFGHLTALPVAEYFDQAPSVEALWGLPGRELAERVEAAAGFPQRVWLIERFLLQQLRNRQTDPLVVAAVDYLYRNPARMSVDQLAATLKISRRQLEKRFLAQEGLTPAAFRSQVRFQKTVRRLMLDPARSLLETALDHGYYDQSHFCRDFKALVGRSPASHLAEARLRTHFYNTPRC